MASAQATARGLCPWCRNSLLPGCCAQCLQRVARRYRRQTPQLESQLPRRSNRHGQLRERLRRLRAQLAQRQRGTARLRAQLEESRERLRQRRKAHEERLADLASAQRRLGARACVPRAQFLQDPTRHQLGAFHIYQELSVVLTALQQERRRRCSELVELLPVKWLQTGAGPEALSLGQVQSLERSGVLQEEELRNLDASLSLLMRLVSGLAACLDVTLPFPCSGGRGFREVASAIEAAIEAHGVRERHRRSATGLASLARPRAPAGGLAPQWVLPCVQNPFTGRWHHFSVYDHICTTEFAAALRMVDQDLLRLCSCQGVALQKAPTLQLLSALLRAEHLGCVSPPGHAEALPRHYAVAPGPAGHEDGEWTVLEVEDRVRS